MLRILYPLAGVEIAVFFWGLHKFLRSGLAIVLVLSLSGGNLLCRWPWSFAVGVKRNPVY